MKLIMENWRKYVNEATTTGKPTRLSELGPPEEEGVDNFLSSTAELAARENSDAWLNAAWDSISALADDQALKAIIPYEEQEGSAYHQAGYDPVATIAHAIMNHPSLMESRTEEDDYSVESDVVSAAWFAYDEAMNRFEEEHGYL